MDSVDSSTDKLSFNVEWHDKSLDIKRQFMLNFYEKDNSVEMVRKEFIFNLHFYFD